MKRFLKTAILYILILGVITTSVNAAYVALRPGRVQDKYDHVPYGIQICNFGSSHGLNGFNYDDVTDETCFNFAMGSQSLSYDCRILKYYLDHLEEGGTAYLLVSFFSFFGADETKEDDFASKNKRYYSFLPKEYIKGFDEKTNLFEVYLPALTADETLFEALFGVAADEDDWDLTTNPADAAVHAPKKYRTHIAANFDEQGVRIINQEEISALYEMIRLCKERGMEPVLITTPYLSEYVDEIKRNDPAFFETFYGLVGEVQTNTGVRYYDYSVDERFAHEYSLFMNTDHLNREGARLFTDIVLEETGN